LKDRTIRFLRPHGIARIGTLRHRICRDVVQRWGGLSHS
jgi:hypothetical protein